MVFFGNNCERQNLSPMQTCPNCGSALSKDRFEGLCPACVVRVMREAPAIDPLTEKTGDKIGHYKLLQQIGEGGCGVVYMAEQEQPVRRRVALKIIKLGMDTKLVVARFEAERQALALMEHPNIAKVLEAGATETGRPFFVMELVRGIRITDYCDQHQLSSTERIELFIQVCQAVQHAHQKGIIHRDLKPSNVLVSHKDGVRAPKVIDFGIAKATAGQRLTDKTLFTAFEQFMGTPAYMSPEQAEMSTLDIDTRSDIYSLGVLLYELLTGNTPFDARQLMEAGLDELRRTIREKEPLRPSTSLSVLTRENLNAIASRRKIESPKLIHLLRGDLDWVVMKCLEKDRTRRYDTANGLAMDLRRYLGNEPVVARPPSAAYRFKKMIRRNTGAALGVAAGVTALLLGILASSWQAVRATRAQGELQRILERERVDAYFHHITLAHRELSVDNLGKALQYLENCPEDLRGWEWNYLMRLGRIEPLVLRHTNAVQSVAFHPGGQRIAAACGDGAIKIWDLAAGKVIQTLSGHEAYVFSVAFRPPEGRYLASASADRTIRLWDAQTGQPIFKRPGPGGEHTGMSGAVTFSADGGRLIAGREDGTLSIWDATDGTELRRLPEKHVIAATCLACSHDGRFLASGSWGGVLRIWDARTFELRHTLTRHPIRIGALAVPTNGQWLATVSFDRTINIWDPHQGELKQSWRGHDSIIPGVAASPDGRRLASCSGEDKAVKLWDPLMGREILNLRGHTLMCTCVAFSPDGQRLASASRDGTIRIWDATPLQPNQTLESHTFHHANEVWTVAFSPDGRFLASAGWDKTVRLWDARTRALIRELPHPGIVFRVAFGPDSRRLAVAAGIGRTPIIFVWDALSGENLTAISEEGITPFCVAFDPTGRYLLKEGPANTVKVFDAFSGEAAGSAGRHDWNIWCMIFSPDGHRLATGSNDGWIKVWAWDPSRLAQPQEPVFNLPTRVGGYGERVAFTPDGHYLVTGGEGKGVMVWNAADGTLLKTLHEHTGDVFAVAIDSEGRWLATAGEDSTIRIWDARSWKRVLTLRGHTGMIGSLAFSPDGQRLVSGSRDHTVKLWDTTRWNDLPGH